MRDDLRQRREDTWEMLVVQGFSYTRVVNRLAEKYNVSEGAIKSDIHRIDDWLPDLNEVSQKSGVSRLRELRQNRQRLQQMALEAREAGNTDEELAIRRQIDKAVQTDVELSQSLGLTDREPDQVEHSGAVTQLTHELTDDQAAQLDEITGGSE